MKTPVLLAYVGLATGLIAPAFSQTAPKDLVGTRMLVSITLEYGGKKMDFFGANPQGQVTFNHNGRFSVARGGINSGRFPQPRWFDRDATERVSNPSPLPLKTAPLA